MATNPDDVAHDKTTVLSAGSGNNASCSSCGDCSCRGSSNSNSSSCRPSSASADKVNSRLQVTTLRASLDKCLECQYGLLDELYRRNFLSSDELDSIRSKSASSDQRNELLHILELRQLLPIKNEHEKKARHGRRRPRGPINRTMSTESVRKQLEDFLEALRDTGQGHLAFLIACFWQVAESSTFGKLDDAEDFRLLSDDALEMLRTQRVRLQNCIEISPTLNEMISTGCITQRHREGILYLTNRTVSQMVGELLDVISRRSVGQFNTFIKCLRSTDQSHVAQLIENKGEPLPLTKIETNSWNIRSANLAGKLEMDELVNKLLSKGVLLHRHREEIDKQSGKSEELLRIIGRRSREHLRSFLHCLNETNQQHIAEELDVCLLPDDQSSVVRAVDTQLSDLSEEQVKILIDKINQLPTDVKKWPVERIKRLFELLQESNITPLNVAERKCVRMFFLCRSRRAILRLCEMMATGRLRQVIETLFRSLMSTDNVVVASLVMSTEPEYCLQPVEKQHHGETHSMQKDELTISKLNLGRLPTELFESLLLKSFAILHLDNWRSLSNPAPVTYESLASVHSGWRKIVAHRRPWFSRALRTYINREVSTGDGVKIELVSSIGVGAGVWGVARLGSTVYAVCQNSSALRRVFLPSSKRIDDVIVEPMKCAADIAGCELHNCLYITDSETCSIWRVHVGLTLDKNDVKTDRWLENIGEPYTVSVASEGRVLRACEDPARIIIYTENAVQLHVIPLPAGVDDPQHAVETSRGTFIVSHGWGPTALHRVCEILADGSIRGCMFGGVRGNDVNQLDSPVHIAVDAQDRVIVADCANDRLIVLHSNLSGGRMLRTWEAEKVSRARRMCYRAIASDDRDHGDERRSFERRFGVGLEGDMKQFRGDRSHITFIGQLYVGLGWGGGSVDVYDVFST